jgi:hypothetical protein
VVEVVTWLTPAGRVLAARPVRSQQVPHRLGPVPAIEERVVPVPVTVGVLTRCPGTRDSWRS